jgi:hypothetical protein
MMCDIGYKRLLPPMKRYKDMHLKLADIPEEIIEEYK